MYIKFLMHLYIKPLLNWITGLTMKLFTDCMSRFKVHLEAYSDFKNSTTRDKEINEWVLAARKIKKEDSRVVHARALAYLHNHNINIQDALPMGGRNHIFKNAYEQTYKNNQP